MKLNYKRTVLVGMAFLSICAFWQLYDNVVQLVLKDTFHLGDSVIGIVMALDNVLALFLLPLFGKLSDKTDTRLGKRTPFIIGGTLAAVVLMNLLPVADNRQNLPLFVTVLGLLLVAMGVYRSPAVALMPDVTPRPLRSKANAVINLMGALGGVFTLGATMFLVRKSADGRADYTLLFLAVSALMAVAVAVLAATIRERRLAKAVADAEEAEGAAEGAGEGVAEGAAEGAKAADRGGRGFASLDPDMRRSFVLILCSVFFWYMGYNAVTSAFTRYAAHQWGRGVSEASKWLMISTVGAVVSYIPVGIVASRVGRKRTVQAGVLVLAGSFAVAATFATFNAGVYVIFALIGAAWAMINVNSYPMAVEIAKSGDVGAFTGYYYTFSMAAQVITPIVSGWLLEHVGYHTLLPYAVVMAAVSFVTISLTKHGDSRPTPPKDKLEAFAGDD